MPMYYPEWSNHKLEGDVVATLTMEPTGFTAVVQFSFCAAVEAKWSIYAYNQYDHDDFPEPPCFESYKVEDLTLYIDGEEADQDSPLYSLCRAWAMDEIKYHDYEADGRETDGKEYDES